MRSSSCDKKDVHDVNQPEREEGLEVQVLILSGLVVT